MSVIYHIEQKLIDGTWVRCSNKMEELDEAMKLYLKQREFQPVTPLRLIKSEIILTTLNTFGELMDEKEMIK